MASSKIVRSTSKNATQAALEVQAREEEVLEGQFREEEAPLSPVVESELDEIIGEVAATPELEIQVVKMSDERYPWLQFDSNPGMQTCPKALYYLGNYQLLATRIATISISKGDEDTEGKNNTAYNRAFREAMKDARNAARSAAVKGITVMVESVRPHDVEIIEAALSSGGSVIVSTPINIRNSGNATLKQYEDRILEGRMLVISYTNTENFRRWNTTEGDTNHEMMASFTKWVYVPLCGARGTRSGVRVMALKARDAGKDVFVRNTTSPIHQELINQYGCKPWNLTPAQA